MTRNTRFVMTVIYWAFVIYLFTPLILMILMGFKDSNYTGFPITSWTTKWYAEVFRDTEVLYIFGYSALIALCSVTAALFIGIWIAVLLSGRRFIGYIVVFALAVLPAIIPGIISAISLRIFARVLGLDPGMFAVICAHTITNVPFVVLVVMARLSTLPKSQIEAAQDLGADPFISFMRVTVPYIKPAIIGASIFSALQSLDDFVRSFFLGGFTPTLPVYIFTKLRSGMSPEINAVATIVLVISATLVVFAERSMARMKEREK